MSIYETEVKEVLKEWASSKYAKLENGQLITRVLDKNDMPSGYVGVASPFLVHDPDTFQPYILFTSWQDVEGQEREVWIARIDEGLNVFNKQQIATADLFGVTGLNTATAFWDDYNEQWVFACTAYGADKESYGYFIFFDKDWNVEDTQVLDFESTFNGSTFTPDLGDAGIGMVPTLGKLVLSVGYFDDRRLYYIDDFTSRPLPSPTYANTSGSYDFPAVSCYRRVGLDVHQLFVYNNSLVMLSELFDHAQSWGITPHFGPEKKWSRFGMMGHFFMPCPVTWRYGVQNYTHMVPNQVTHPHYTTELGTPLLFFTTFPSLAMGGSRAYSHEIWAQTIDPSKAFDPVENFPLVAMNNNSVIPYDIGKVPIPTFGADTATIEIYGAASAGTLTVIEANAPNPIWNEGTDRYTDDLSIDSGASKNIMNKPAPYMAVKTDVDVDKWSITLRG